MKEYRIRREYVDEPDVSDGWTNHPLFTTTDERAATFKWEEVRSDHMISEGRAVNQNRQVARLIFESREVNSWGVVEEVTFGASS